MTTLDLRQIPADTVAIHYGGRLGRVDAYTFANSLVAFAEAIQEINAATNPDYKLSVTVDALGRGSFRAKLRMAPKAAATLLKKTWNPVVLPLLLMFIYDKLIATDPDIRIEVSDDVVVIQRGDQQIIINRDVFDARRSVSTSRNIDGHLHFRR